jgi:LPXTG-motif cell wall-anchored protein
MAVPLLQVSSVPIAGQSTSPDGGGAVIDLKAGSGGSSDTGAIAGAVGAIIFLALVLLGAYLLRRRRNQQGSKSSSLNRAGKQDLEAGLVRPGNIVGGVVQASFCRMYLCLAGWSSQDPCRQISIANYCTTAERSKSVAIVRRIQVRPSHDVLQSTSDRCLTKC